MFNTSYSSYCFIRSQRSSFSPIHSTSLPCTLHLGLQDHRKGATMWSHLNDTVTSGPTFPKEWLKESNSYFDSPGGSIEFLSQLLLGYLTLYHIRLNLARWWLSISILNTTFNKYNIEHTKQKTKERKYNPSGIPIKSKPLLLRNITFFLGKVLP